MINLPQIANGASASGAMSGNEIEALQKALEMGYGTDQAALQGGGALRIQSLDKTMKSTIQENKHFALFNALLKNNATATVDEWTEQSGVGGFLGGSTNTETGTINGAQGQYNRRVGLVKYLMTRREVSYVSTITGNIVAAEAVENQNGALQLLTDAEYLCFSGDSSVVPTEFDGIYAQIASLDGGSHVIDVAGGQLNDQTYISKAAALITGYGNYGQPTHLFLSQLTQSDFDTHLDPAFRVGLTSVTNGGVGIGAPVVGIRTSWGDIKPVQDVFVLDEPQQMPFELQFPAVATANNAFQPAGVAVVGAAGSASSMWKAPQAGNFYYAVAGVTANGQSQAVVSAAATVAAGGKVTITITRSASGSETGYVIYRGRLNGTNGLADLRQMVRIPASGGASTVYVDENRDIPGSVKATMLSMGRGGDAINWRQLLPMTKFPLFPTVSATVPWAQLLFGYLRITKRKHHVVFKNIVPTGAVWKPF